MLVPLSRTRDYLSIGEVLGSVQEDFPDISISKIRFLESEGLINPERTPSGYRKFFEEDVRRLRYILTLQRDHFLPLRVIKDRLAAGEDSLPVPPAAPIRQNGKAAVESSGTAVSSLHGDVHLSREELLTASGLSAGELASLQDFGVIPPADTYGGDDLVIAKAAKGFLEFGVEARHLKMYRQFAERQLGLFEQLIGPAARKTDPESLQAAAATTARLVELGRALHDATVRSAASDL